MVIRQINADEKIDVELTAENTAVKQGQWEDSPLPLSTLRQNSSLAPKVHVGSGDTKVRSTRAEDRIVYSAFSMRSKWMWSLHSARAVKLSGIVAAKQPIDTNTFAGVGGVHELVVAQVNTGMRDATPICIREEQNVARL
jgi:hypothetical protein